MKIAVIALGKIGLPLAAQYARKGHHVTGVDINEATVAAVNAAREPFPGEDGLAGALREIVPAGRLVATTHYAEAIPGADAVVVVVPLFVDGEGKPDFAAMDSATRSLAEHLTPGTLVSYETTLPVGTLRGRWLPLIEEVSGLKEGSDFHLVFSPERVLTGRVFADLAKYPKLIGALSDAGAAQARQFYESVLDFDERADLARPNGVWDLGSAEAAELAKLAETTYRDVNIGLANQFARFAGSHGIDVHAVIEACNSQPYSHIHRPGIAVGGHCIPIYPRLYLSVDPDATIVRAAREANAAMPAYAVSLAIAAAGGSLAGKRVVVLGAAYRGGVKETAFSGVFATAAAITAAGGTPLVHDPLYTDEELAALGLTPYHLGESAGIVILHTDHAQYRDLTATQFPGISALIDGRNTTDPGNWPGITRIVLGNGQHQ